MNTRPPPEPIQTTAAYEANFQAMSPATKELARRVRELRNKASADYVLAHLEIGAELDRAADNRGGKYGEKALEQIAVFCGMSPADGDAQLAEYRRMARVISAEEIQTFAQRVGANGRTLTLRHWGILARVADKAQREQLRDRAALEGLSYRELEAEAAVLTRFSTRKGAGRKPPVPATLPLAVSQTLGQLKRVRNLRTNFDEHLIGFLKAPDAAFDPLMADRLVELRQEAEAVRDQADRWVADLDANWPAGVPRPPEKPRARKSKPKSESAGPAV